MQENTNRYTHRVSLTENHVKPFLALCQKAITLLHWELKTASQSKYVINTPANDGISNYILTVEILENEADITCISLDTTSSDDEDRCRDYVITFLSAIDELKAHIEAGMQVEELPEKEESGFKSFLHFVTPRKDYLFTPILLALNVIVFIAMIIDGANVMSPSIQIMLDWGANFSAYTLNGQAWRLVTACFLHFGIFHLLFNMYALLYVGTLLEPIIGKWRFIIIYLIAGVGGNVASLYFNQLSVGAGASGAIFGLYGAFIALLTTNIIEREARSAFMGSMLLFVGYNLFYGFTQKNIGNAAHIGGLITGAIISYLFCLDLLATIKNNKRQNKISIAGTAIVIVALIIGLNSAPAGLALYEENRETFTELEEEALSVLRQWDNLDDNTKLQLIEKEKYRWVECMELMHIKHYNNLPETIEQSREFLFEYSILRQQQYNALSKWLQTKSIEDDNEVAKLSFKVDSILKRNQPVE
jgi:rhomboid protease GluP